MLAVDIFLVISIIFKMLAYRSEKFQWKRQTYVFFLLPSMKVDHPNPSLNLLVEEEMVE